MRLPILIALFAALCMLVSGCGKRHTVTTDKPKVSSVTTVETVPVTTKQTKTTTFDASGKPVKVEVAPLAPASVKTECTVDPVTGKTICK